MCASAAIFEMIFIFNMLIMLQRTDFGSPDALN
jgi:hypothetical protein